MKCFRTIYDNHFHFTGKQKKAWREKHIIPLKVLSAIWHNGIHYIEFPPQQGQRACIVITQIRLFIKNCNDPILFAEASKLYSDLQEQVLLLEDYYLKMIDKEIRLDWEKLRPARKERMRMKARIPSRGKVEHDVSADKGGI